MEQKDAILSKKVKHNPPENSVPPGTYHSILHEHFITNYRKELWTQYYLILPKTFSA